MNIWAVLAGGGGQWFTSSGEVILQKKQKSTEGKEPHYDSRALNGALGCGDRGSTYKKTGNGLEM